MSEESPPIVRKVVPTGDLLHLSVGEIRPSPGNPRRLFDPAPLAALKESIRTHGVLVPLTVYKLPGQEKYGIVDGERRYRCCVILAEEGQTVEIPANVVTAPDSMASLIYMFNIHTFRQQWELMPTALGLRRVIENLNNPSDEEIHELTGLSFPQITRCRVILGFPKRFQEMSLEDDPTKRIPSNFWIELAPVLDLIKLHNAPLVAQIGIESILDKLVEKYRAHRIRSVVHFRRIVEAFEVSSESREDTEKVVDALRNYILDVNAETRDVFDRFIVDQRKIQKAADACTEFITNLSRAHAEYVVEADERARLVEELRKVVDFASLLIDKLSSSDPPSQTGN
jgi:ParB family chromosome partitioning protein